MRQENAKKRREEDEKKRQANQELREARMKEREEQRRKEQERNRKVCILSNIEIYGFCAPITITKVLTDAVLTNLVSFPGARGEKTAFSVSTSAFPISTASFTSSSPTQIVQRVKRQQSWQSQTPRLPITKTTGTRQPKPQKAC